MAIVDLAIGGIMAVVVGLIVWINIHHKRKMQNLQAGPSRTFEGRSEGNRPPA